MATFKSTVSANVGAVQVSLLTASRATTLIGVTAANVTTAGAMITFKIIKTGGGGTAHIVKDAPVSRSDTLIVVGGDQKVVLETGDQLVAVANLATSFDVIVSYMEL